jgi:hypothetical protein
VCKRTPVCGALAFVGRTLAKEARPSRAGQYK